MTTPQQPIGSGFGARSTAAEVVAGIDLTGRLAIVTGGYSGLGAETTRALAGAGAHVIVPARRRTAAEENLAGVEGDVEIDELDLPTSTASALSRSASWPPSAPSTCSSTTRPS